MLVLLAVAVVSSLALGCMTVGAALDVRRRAQTTADLAAIAAASHPFDSSDQACERAARVVDANLARLRACVVLDSVAEVVVELRAAVRLVGGTVVARARAGPATDISAQ